MGIVIAKFTSRNLVPVCFPSKFTCVLVGNTTAKVGEHRTLLN